MTAKTPRAASSWSNDQNDRGITAAPRITTLDAFGTFSDLHRQIELIANPETAEAVSIAPGYAQTPTGVTISTRASWKPKPLKPRLNAKGYQRINLQIDGKHTTKNAHQLTAAAFIGPPPDERSQVRHLDGDKTNNNRENLAYGSAKDNADDDRRNGTLQRRIAKLKATWQAKTPAERAAHAEAIRSGKLQAAQRKAP